MRLLTAFFGFLLFVEGWYVQEKVYLLNWSRICSTAVGG